VITENTVTVVWEIKLLWNNQNNYWWNEVCADVVEIFGLPGDRFTSHPYDDCMLFRFKSKKDYQLCKILLSERL
jgi:hypothetical protein